MIKSAQENLILTRSLQTFMEKTKILITGYFNLRGEICKTKRIEKERLKHEIMNLIEVNEQLVCKWGNFPT